MFYRIEMSVSLLYGVLLPRKLLTCFLLVAANKMIQSYLKYSLL